MSQPNSQLRLFIAAALPAGLLNYFAETTAQFSSGLWRVVPEENLHLTLLFMGNKPAHRLAELKEKLQKIAAAHKPFSLSLLQTEPGPQQKAPRLIWARFAQSQPFENLAKHLQTELAPEVGLPKKLIPHVTLARKKKEAAHAPDLPVIVPNQPVCLAVSEICLWQSELGSPHPAYHILDRFALVNSTQKTTA